CEEFLLVVCEVGPAHSGASGSGSNPASSTPGGGPASAGWSHPVGVSWLSWVGNPWKPALSGGTTGSCVVGVAVAALSLCSCGIRDDRGSCRGWLSYPSCRGSDSSVV